MNKTGYLKFAVTLLLAAVIFFGILIVNGLDRIQRSIRDLEKTIAKQPVVVSAAVPAAELPAAKSGKTTVANAEFFDPEAQPGGRMIQATAADSENLNHLINNDATVSHFHSLTNSTLAERNFRDQDRFEPLMAESWEISDDHLVYKIKLRKGILWHDFTDPVTGKEWRKKEVTAHDFKFYLDLVRNPDVNCEALRNYYQDLDKIEIQDDYNFTVRWKRPFYGSKESTLFLSPMPRHLYDDYPEPFDGKRFNNDHLRNRVLVGCGPYRFDRWEKDVRIVFTRFEDYFGKALGIQPPLEQLAFDIIKHPNTRFQALLDGQIDLLGLTPEQWISRTDSAPFTSGRIRKMHGLNHAYSYIGYNQANPLFQDRRVRKALTMLVDRERIRKEIYFELAESIATPFFPGSIYADASIKPLPYDVEAAKKLLAEAGWRDSDGDGILDKDGKPFVFTILQVASNPSQARMLPLLKESFGKAGIDMKIQPLEWSVYLQRLKSRDYEVCTLAWTMPYEPDLYQVWHSSLADVPGSSNHIGYKNPELDKLIETMRATFDREERIKLAHQMAKILHEDQPYTFLFISYNLTAFSGRYENVLSFPATGLITSTLWTPKEKQLSVPGL